MKKVLILDAFCPSHVGNGALLDNSYNLIKKILGEDTEIYICAWEPSEFRKKYNNVFGLYFPKLGSSSMAKMIWLISNSFFAFIHVINQFTFKFPSRWFTWSQRQRTYFSLVEQCDICVSISGEALNETFKKPLSVWLFSYWYASKRGKKLILFPQSVGPFNKKIWQRLVYVALKNATGYYGRDNYSILELKKLGFAENKIHFSPDVAIFQSYTNVDIDKYFTNNGKKIVGITISNPPAEFSQSFDYGQIIINSLSTALNPKEFKILLMPSNFSLNGKSKDYNICEKVRDSLSVSFETAILENRVYFPDEYKGLLLQLDFFISTRMHVLIIATSGGIPTIGINTQRKIRGYMSNIGIENYCIDIDNIDKELPSKIMQLLQNKDLLRGSIPNKIKDLQKEELDSLLKIRKDLVK